MIFLSKKFQILYIIIMLQNTQGDYFHEKNQFIGRMEII